MARGLNYCSYGSYGMVTGGGLILSAAEVAVYQKVSGTGDEQEKEAKEHGPVGTCFVCCGPYSLMQHWDLGGPDGHRDYDEQRNGGEAGKESEDDEDSAGDLKHSNQRREQVRVGNTDFGEAACAEGDWEDEFLNSFRDEDAADEQAHQGDGGGCGGAGPRGEAHKTPGKSRLSFGFAYINNSLLGQGIRAVSARGGWR